MSPLKVKTVRKTESGSVSRQSRLFKTAIESILEKKGENVVSLDMRKIPEAVCDFFIICEATTSTQVKAIGDHLQDAIKEACGEFAHRHEGYQHAKWVLVDYVNLVVHIMQPETRRFYQLEEMWSDAPLQHHTDRLPNA